MFSMICWYAKASFKVERKSTSQQHANLCLRLAGEVLKATDVDECDRINLNKDK